MNRLRQLRKEKGLYLVDMANYLGITITAYNHYEHGTRDLSTEKLIKLAEFFNVTTDYLLCKTNTKIQKNSNAKVLIYGSIPAGIPMEMIEDIVDEEEISADMLKGGKEFFGLKIKGNSMEDKYKNGDIVIFEKSSTCENGQDCVVMVNGNEGTFKRVYINDNSITLQPLNIELYSPITFTSAQVNSLPVRILGIAREIRRKI